LAFDENDDVHRVDVPAVFRSCGVRGFTEHGAGQLLQQIDRERCSLIAASAPRGLTSVLLNDFPQLRFCRCLRIASCQVALRIRGKPIAACPDRHDQSVRAVRISQRSAKISERARQSIRAHRDAVPHSLEQLSLGYDAVLVRGQVGQEIQRLLLNPDRSSALPELRYREVQLEL